MFPNYFLLPILTPFIPEYNDKPVTLYAILQSLVNYGKEDKTKIRNLAKEGRSKIFDFDYPLSNYVNKEEFETNILNHFMKRRIGFQTVTDFKIHLEVKLNEIMPMYNKMFDVLEKYNIFEGEKTIKDGTGNRTVDNQSEMNNNSTSNVHNVTDNRYSELPQSEIQNVKNASYLTKYTLDDSKTDSRDESKATGKNNTKDDNIYHEEETRIDPKLMLEYMENVTNIYTLIYKKLDCLFYQLI